MIYLKKLYTAIVLRLISILSISFLLYSCAGRMAKSNYRKDLFAYCEAQAKKTVEENPAINLLPVVIDKNNKQWTNNSITNWRSGFWPGIEWYLFESTKDEYWKKQAEKSTTMLSGIFDKPVANHDLGFQLYCSYGNGYRLTGNSVYKEILLRAADSLAVLFNSNSCIYKSLRCSSSCFCC